MPSLVACVAVSGGVDSLASLLLIKNLGWSVLAVHCLFHGGDAPPQGLAAICSHLGAPLHILDLRESFKAKVIRPFLQDYRRLRTPNPCAICNRAIKFDLLQTRMAALGAEVFVTGHYARTRGQGQLLKGLDNRKDQSYFLSLVPAEKLARVVFPLGDWEKKDVKELVRASGLKAPLPRESQDLCFTDNASEYLARHLGGGKGLIIVREENGTENIVGEHDGLWRYTIGQRKGLRISWREPLYVIAKENNNLILAARKNTGMKGFSLEDCNFYIPWGQWPLQIQTKARYTQNAICCQAEYDGNRLHIRLQRETIPTSPGQIGCIYDEGGRVLAGGIVCSIQWGG